MPPDCAPPRTPRPDLALRDALRWLGLGNPAVAASVLTTLAHDTLEANHHLPDETTHQLQHAADLLAPADPAAPPDPAAASGIIYRLAARMAPPPSRGYRTAQPRPLVALPVALRHLKDGDRHRASIILTLLSMEVFEADGHAGALTRQLDRAVALLALPRPEAVLACGIVEKLLAALALGPLHPDPARAPAPGPCTGDGWLPIQDAPRDGTAIIGRVDGEPVEMRWAETRVCMLAATGSGTGYYGEGCVVDAWMPVSSQRRAPRLDRRAGPGPHAGPGCDLAAHNPHP